MKDVYAINRIIIGYFLIFSIGNVYNCEENETKQVEYHGEVVSSSPDDNKKKVIPLGMKIAVGASVLFLILGFSFLDFFFGNNKNNDHGPGCDQNKLIKEKKDKWQKFVYNNNQSKIIELIEIFKEIETELLINIEQKTFLQVLEDESKDLDENANTKHIFYIYTVLNNYHNILICNKSMNPNDENQENANELEPILMHALAFAFEREIKNCKNQDPHKQQKELLTEKLQKYWNVFRTFIEKFKELDRKNK